MKGKKEVIDILNEALKLELGAINQYWLHYRMLDNWGFTKLAKKERKESIEEMQHADKLVDRIIFLEGLPNLQHVAPLMIGQNLKEVLECDLKGEHIARDLYTRAREVCRKNEDLVSMQLFEELLKDEEGHIDFLETPARPARQDRRAELRPAAIPTRPTRWKATDGAAGIGLICRGTSRRSASAVSRRPLLGEGACGLRPSPRWRRSRPPGRGPCRPAPWALSAGSRRQIA